MGERRRVLGGQGCCVPLQGLHIANQIPIFHLFVFNFKEMVVSKVCPSQRAPF